MRISTNLPAAIHSLMYVKNSHWIELEDHDGRRTRLFDNALMRYTCRACAFLCLCPSNAGPLRCPLCGQTLDQEWQRVQVCFVPEDESDFHMPQAAEEKEPP